MDSNDRLRELDRWLERRLRAEEEGEALPENGDARAMRLLAQSEWPLGGLERPPASDPAFGACLTASLAEIGEIEPGTRIGPFEIEHAIGAGGMGVVYRARRVEGGFSQTVALKVLAGGRPDAPTILRFEREREVLSSLNHPGIARLIDGGLSEEGRPWFAMEYVDGEPIERHCNRLCLGVRRRLELFIQVCQALDYAHGQLVLHRDIKPANILVDASGRTRLVDFGLGTQLAEPNAQGAERTRLSRRWLTPEYASPEQLQGQAIDVRSEVYQLGLVLYRLLCGTSPYEVDADSPAQWVEAVVETSPTLPSNRWRAGLKDDRQFPRTARGMRRRLRGDLDRIVFQALRKEPERRYASARELAADLKRHLQGLPVAARGDSLRYRVGKLVSRHPVSIAGLVGVVVLGAVAVGVHVERLQTERDRAEIEASKARMISDFLVGLFESADPVYEAGPDLQVGELLDRGARQLEALDGQPVIQARMAEVLAQVHRALGELDRSHELAERTVELLRAAHGKRDPRLVPALNSLGLALQHLERPAEAREVHEQALSIVRSQTPVPQNALADTYLRLGNAQRLAGNFTDALEAHDQALAIRVSSGGESSQAVGYVLNARGLTHFRLGNFEQSLADLRRASQLFTSHFGSDHAVTIKTDTRLAAVKNHMGDHEGAAEVLSQLLEAARSIYGETHPAVATAWFELAYARYQAGDHEAAGVAWQKSLAIQKEVFGPDHVEVAGTLQALAAVAREEGDLERAESLLQQVRSVYKAQLPPRSSAIAANLNNLGTIRADRGAHEDALEHYRRALEIYREVYGDDHAKVASVLHRMAEVNLALERQERARQQIARALEIRTNALPADHPDLASTRELAARFDAPQ